ncbi:MAG: 50S ribosomal protein L5 [Candidatus Pacebacteria bacterium]|nr:50S ribosomal protein L5 [Candidatus Paceibacterota bacterium]
MIISLKEKYIKEAVPKMMVKFGYSSSMAVPKIVKVAVNTGFGKQIAGKTNDEQKKHAQAIAEDLGTITGQKVLITVARKSIASFKVREGMALGAKATLRGKRMYDFLDKLIHLVLPRTRDFRGIDPKSLDPEGSLTFAIREHIAFPEILPEKIRNMFGLEITVVTTAKNKEEGLELLKLLGFPLRRE